MKKYTRNKSDHKRIARERIEELFRQADIIFRKDQSMSDRYVELARKMAMKYKVRIPSELKRRFCSHCHSFLVPGVNARVRTNKGKVVYYCLKCKRFSRVSYRH